ncbi:MAG: PadR family transcriptional regulator [Actinomycetota bacterium]|nr:PadR family transcriptional regulator [Actinomycetota bacterium]
MRDERFFYKDEGEGEGESRSMRGRCGFGPGGFGLGPRGFGPGGPRGVGPRGPGSGPGSGRRRRGDVRLALLMLLSLEGPLNGYQLMQGLEQRSDGRWRPSPGSVYPALQQLEDEGLIRAANTEGESGRAFELTDSGRAHLSEHGEHRPPWELGPGEHGHPAHRLHHSIRGLARAAAHALHDGTPEQAEAALEILDEARRKLYRLLAGDE